MIDAIIVFLFVLAGVGIGFHSVELLPTEVLHQVENLEGLRWVMTSFSGLIGILLGITAQTTYHRLESRIRKTPTALLLSQAVGLVLGLLVANLLLAPILLLPLPQELGFIKPLTAIFGSVVFAYSGINLAGTHGHALLRLINPHSIETMLVAEGTLKPASAKILDTSCIIDGRIEKLLSTKFIEGQFLVPQFVLEELQTLADSANDQKRVRGRRGLDILNRLKETYPEQIFTCSADYEEIASVDAKLVRLAQEIDGALVTNDYNLNKVASVQKVQVLNINDLAQAIRPVYLPGDLIELKILREGKEAAQGVGYLEDGTMVVVEEGRESVGEKLSVVVTSALQTSAGRMIFARPKASAFA